MSSALLTFESSALCLICSALITFESWAWCLLYITGWSSTLITYESWAWCVLYITGWSSALITYESWALCLIYLISVTLKLPYVKYCYITESRLNSETTVNFESNYNGEYHPS